MLQDITDHRTIKVSNSSYEVLVYWEYGHATWEPVSVMRRDDPIYLVNNARDNSHLDKPVWKQLCFYANNAKKINCLLKDTKAKQTSNTVNIEFVTHIPSDHKEMMMFDEENGNTN